MAKKKTTSEDGSSEPKKTTKSKKKTTTSESGDENKATSSSEPQLDASGEIKTEKPKKKSSQKQAKLGVESESESIKSKISESQDESSDVVSSDADSPQSTDEADAKPVKEVLEASIDEEVMDEQAIKAPKLPEKFWQKDIWRVLLDPSLVEADLMNKYDLAKLLNDFTQEMLKTDLVDFRISGMAIYNSAKIHHKKIKDVIDEEEQVQLKEMKERAKREVPQAMAQPLREPRKIATSDELFEAMRAAIIETMQKREVLKRKREERENRRQELKVIQSKGKLPLDILKHITGKEKTIEEILNSWYEKIKAKTKLNDSKKTTYQEIVRDIIEQEHPNDAYGRKYQSIQLFIALLFLSTGGTGSSSPRTNISQNEDFGEIDIEINRL